MIVLGQLYVCISPYGFKRFTTLKAKRLRMQLSSSAVEHSLSMCEALGLIPTTEKKNIKQFCNEILSGQSKAKCIPPYQHTSHERISIHLLHYGPYLNRWFLFITPSNLSIKQPFLQLKNHLRVTYIHICGYIKFNSYI